MSFFLFQERGIVYKNQSTGNKTGSGFTLIELMIAITIVALLSVLALLTLSNLQKRGRDSKRQSDLGTIQSALEQYHADQQYYPASWTISSGSPLSFNGVTYLGSPPTDPKFSNGYLYNAYNNYNQGVSCNNSTLLCNTYCIFSTLELSSVNNFNSNCQNNPVNNPTFNYSVSSP